MLNKRDLASTLSVLLSVTLLVPPVPLQAAGSDPVVVTPGTPSIWSMEQAHYLLNRLRSGNDALRTRLPGEADLDPNAVNALRLDAEASRLGVAGTFNQITAFKNQLALQGHAAGIARQAADQPRLAALRETLTADQLQLATQKGQKAKLEKQKAAIPTGGPANPQIESALAEAEGNIVQLEERIKVTKEQIAEASTAVPAPTFEAVEPGSVPAPLPKQLESVVKDLMKKTADGFNSPRLHASTVLDNTLRLQYEIVAKQLTTLRDEAGRGQRIIFLELPTSIASADRKLFGQGGEDQLAQAWWRVKRIHRRYKIEDSPCWVGVEKPERLYWNSGLDGTSIDSLYHTMNQGADGKGQSTTSRQQQSQDGDIESAIKDIKTLYGKLSYDQLEKTFPVLRDAPADKSGTGLLKAQADAVEEFGANLRLARQKLEGERDLYYATLDSRPDDDQRANLHKIEARCIALRNRVETEDRAWSQSASRVKSQQNDKALGEEARDFAAAKYKFLQSIKHLRDDQLEDRMAKLQIEIVKTIGGTRYLSTAFSKAIGDTELQAQTGLVRAVEMIPSQTSLNVNSAHSLTKESAFSGAAKFLFGFGLKVDYQHQHEKYDQFMQQETFASGFGKGKATFGWTFGPNPGTRVLNSGIRSTFAVLAIPDDVTAIEFESRGCAFNRKTSPLAAYPDQNRDDVHCGAKANILVGVPNQINSGGFWPTEVEFATTKPGAPVSVLLKGDYFSPQTTVLVNGRRLNQVVGLGKPPQGMDASTAQESATPDTEISGAFEFVNESNIAMQLNVPLKYDGPDFPNITLIAPRRAINVNRLRLKINGHWGKLSDDYSLFEAPPAPKLNLSGARFLSLNPASFRAYLTGTLLADIKDVRLNGAPCAAPVPIGAALLDVTCTPSPLPEWQFIAVNSNDPKKVTVATWTVPNPLQLVISSQRVLDAETLYERKVPKQITVQLTGSGFTPGVRLSLQAAKANRFSLSYVSPTELRCVILKPDEQETVTLSLGAQNASIDVPRPANQPDAPLTPGTSKKTLTKQEETVVTKN